jgi:hypothetical protein
VACGGARNSTPSIVLYANNSATSLAMGDVCPGATSVTLRPNGLEVVATCLEAGVLNIPLDTSRAVTTLLNRTQCTSPLGCAIRQRDGGVIAACGGAGLILALNGTVRTIVNGTQCPGAASLVIRRESPGDGDIFAASISFSGGVYRIINGTPQKMLFFTECAQPSSVVIRPSPGDDLVVVSCFGTSGSGVLQFSVSNVSAVTSLTTTTQCPRASSVALGPSGSIVAACQSGSVIQIVKPTVSTVVSVAVCRAAGKIVAVDMGAEGTTLLAACVQSGVIRVRNGTASMLIPGTSCLNTVAVAYRSRDGDPSRKALHTASCKQSCSFTRQQVQSSVPAGKGSSATSTV